MLRLVTFALAAYCYLQSGFALADDAAKQLVGSWRLSSWVIQIIGGGLETQAKHVILGGRIRARPVHGKGNLPPERKS